MSLDLAGINAQVQRMWRMFAGNPVLPNDATVFLDGTGAYTVPPGTAVVPGWGGAGYPLDVKPGTAESDGVATTVPRSDHVHGWGGMSPITASLGADVNLSNISNYFDGPSIAQGSTGTWWVSGSVDVQTIAAPGNVFVKLWDGTTVIASGLEYSDDNADIITIHLSGYLASPAGNLRLSVKYDGSTSAKIRYNTSGNSKDSTISAIRVA